MSITHETLLKIAHLARLSIRPEEIQAHQDKLSRIMEFVEKLQEINTEGVVPLAHPFDLSQRLRSDVVTEVNLRDKFQEIAPLVEAGLYLVPKVIDEAP